MTSRRRRSRVPLDGPPPLFRRLGEQVRKAITPPPPPRPWQEVVPDPHLRRYFTAIWDADAIRVWDMPIYLSGLRMLVGEEDEHTRAHRIGEYWRFGPLRTLSLKLIYHSEDPSRGIVLAPARVRGRLIRNICAVFEADMLCAQEAASSARRSYRLAYTAAHARGGAVPELTSDWLAIRDAAWGRVFDESEATLRHRFAVDHRELSRADLGPPTHRWEEEWTRQHKRHPSVRERVAIEEAHGVEPWHDRPDHFILWAWEHHRRVEHADLQAYELDQAHWALLTGEGDPPDDDTDPTAEG
jgi:hypothetical protein